MADQVRASKAEVQFSGEVARSLADSLANEAFAKMGSKVEYARPWDADELQSAALRVHNRAEEAKVLLAQRVPLSRWLIELVAQQMGRCEGLELDGVPPDDEEAAKRQKAREAWAVVQKALAEATPLAADGYTIEIPVEYRDRFDAEVGTANEYMQDPDGDHSEDDRCEALCLHRGLREIGQDVAVAVKPSNALWMAVSGCILKAGKAVACAGEVSDYFRARRDAERAMRELTFWYSIAGELPAEVGA